MCPFCLATALLVASGVAGTGGLGALMAGKILKRRSRSEFSTQTGEQEVRHGDSHDDSKAE